MKMVTTQASKTNQKRSGENFIALQELLINRYLKKEPGKVVLILGAGASYWSRLKSWSAMKKAILETACAAFAEKDFFIKEAWKQLSPKIGLRDRHLSGDKLWKAFWEIFRRPNSPITIEDICSIAGKFHVLEKSIQSLLQKEYGQPNDEHSIGYVPQLASELIAHLLMHRFVDHIITHNFDESLDTSLINELEEEHFVRIISDKQIVSEDVESKPCVFKLHGSVSASDSMRFTDEDTSIMSDEMINHLDNVIFEGAIETGPDQPIHLISFGYSFSDTDFVNWIDSRSKFISSLTVFKRSKSTMASLEKIKQQNIDIRYIATKELSPNYPIGIDQAIWALCDELEKELISKKIPHVPFSRHLILGQVFGPNYNKENTAEVLKHPPLNEHNALHRFYVEFYLYLVKCRGMYNYNALANNPRIHRYFRQFKKIANYEREFKRIIESCKIEQAPDVKETFFSKFSTEELINNFNRIGLFPGGSYVHIPSFIASQGIIKINTEILSEDFWRIHLRKIIEGPEVEILPSISPQSEWLFKQPQSLNTYYDLNAHTRKIIQQPYTHLLLIAETGEWIFNKPEYLELLRNIKEKGEEEKQILLIQADSISHWEARKDIDNEIEENRNALERPKPGEPHKRIRSSIAGMPWFDHNRHLTLAIDLNGNKIEEVFNGGIFFERRMKGSRISPVFVSREDCTALFSIFCNYTRRIYSKSTPVADKSLLENAKYLSEQLYAKFPDDEDLKYSCDLLKEIT